MAMEVSAARRTLASRRCFKNIREDPAEPLCIAQQAHGLDGGDLDLRVEIVQPELNARAGRFVADLL